MDVDVDDGKQEKERKSYGTHDHAVCFTTLQKMRAVVVGVTVALLVGWGHAVDDAAHHTALRRDSNLNVFAAAGQASTTQPRTLVCV